MANKLTGMQTPFYLYDMDLLARTAQAALDAARKYDIEIHYATKANENKRIITYFAQAGFGADCISGPEVANALKCGIPAEKIVFSGVGKTDSEMLTALKAGIGMFNVESVHELYILNAIAGKFGLEANISLRVNPNIDAHTFRYITSGLEANKFGLPDTEFDDFVKMLEKCPNVHFQGIHFHIGSQIPDVKAVCKDVCKVANKVIEWFEAHGLSVNSVNLGGGLGVDYENPDANPIPDFESWMAAIDKYLKRRPGMSVHLEPGRSLVAQCGTLYSSVLFTKDTAAKSFVILDAGMNDMIRPALYGAYHKIDNISAEERPSLEADQVYDVVGPVGESSDTWGKGRRLPMTVRGDLVAICSVGAYGQSMSNRYNLRAEAQTVYSDRLWDAAMKPSIL